MQNPYLTGVLAIAVFSEIPLFKTKSDIKRHLGIKKEAVNFKNSLPLQAVFTAKGLGKIDEDVVLSKTMIWQTTPIQRTPNKASVNEGLLVAVYCNEQT